MPDIKVRVGQQNTVKVLASAYGGSLTAETATNVVGGIASVTSLRVGGASTLGGPVGLGSDLNVAGVSTFVGVSTFGGDVYIGGDLYLKDDITLDDITANSLTISGITTLTGNVNLGGSVNRLDVTGISTFSDDITLATNKKLKVGTANTVSLWNNGAITRLIGEGNAVIYIDTPTSLSVGTGATSSALFKPATSVDLSYAGTKRFQTAGTGVTVTGTVYSDQLNITGVSTFNDDVVFTGQNTNARWDKSKSDLVLFNNTRLTLGDNEDLQMWHGGSHTFIKNTGGDLRIRGDKILLKREDGSETYLEANVNQDVKLFYNGTERFATISTGATVTGDLYVSGDLSLDDITLDHINGTTLNITGIATFGSNVSIGGTLTYEDVTNVDSVGIVTAGQGLRATAGGIDVTAGISTFRQGINVAGLSYLDGDVSFVGASYNLLWDKDTSKLKFYDLAQLTFGDGNDLQIYSDGTNGIIKGNSSTNILGITSVTSVDYYGTDATLTGTLTAGLIDGGSY